MLSFYMCLFIMTLQNVHILFAITQLYEQATDRSTDLGNLFVAFGNAELSNSMASYTADHKVSVIKTFTLLVVHVLLCMDNVEIVPFVFRSRQILSTSDC
jgi:hypothetical protein